MPKDRTKDTRDMISWAMVIFSLISLFGGSFFLLLFSFVLLPLAGVAWILCYSFRYSDSNDPSEIQSGKSGGTPVRDNDPDIQAHLRHKSVRNSARNQDPALLAADYAGRRAGDLEPMGKMPMPLPGRAAGDASTCPLCHQPNTCAATSGHCWCFDVVVPPALLSRVPVAQRGAVCICRNCVAAYHAETTGTRSVSPGPNIQSPLP